MKVIWGGDDLLTELVRVKLIEEGWADRTRRYVRGKARGGFSSGTDVQLLDRRFGQLSLRRGWVSVGDLEVAILEQELLRRFNLRFQIGEILVCMGTLSVEQVRIVLRDQGIAQRHCEECAAIVNALELDAERQQSCPFCEGDLSEVIFLEGVRSDNRKLS